MKKNQNILSSVLLASTLTLTPVITTSLNANTHLKANSLSNSIAKNLHRRGIDRDASLKIANNLFNIDEELFALMLQNLEYSCDSLSKNAILDFLTNQALMQKNVQLDSYSYLVNMLYQIKQQAPTQDELKKMNTLAIKNSLFVNI